MKKTLLIIVLLACPAFFAQTNLVLNGTGDEFDGSDNAAAFDMTPSSSVGSFKDLWNNTDLDAYLNENCGDSDEQPGSTSDGQLDENDVKTRGFKLYEACRRLYQKIAVTPGVEYTFSVESRAEAENVNLEVFILNEEITSEAGLTASSTSVDHYVDITNHFNADKPSAGNNTFTKTEFSFTASKSVVVIYMRASNAVSSSEDVFIDNIMLYTAEDSVVEPVLGDELVLNGTGDEFDGSDNAAAFDMTPSSSVGSFKDLWNNTDLDAYLNENCGDSDEQPGSTSDGQLDENDVKTRGFKLYEACRRLYQKIAVTPGVEYTFSVESRAEAENVNLEVFILNEEITSEAGLTASSTSVDHYVDITNHFNADKPSAGNNTFTKTEFSFTASKSVVVIYMRASNAVSSSEDVFIDNISLKALQTASVDDVFSSKVSVYPNPANEFVTISTLEKIDRVEVFNLLGKQVIKTSTLNNNILDVSSLSKGVYLMKLTSGNSVATRKFIKN